MLNISLGFSQIAEFFQKFLTQMKQILKKYVKVIFYIYIGYTRTSLFANILWCSLNMETKYPGIVVKYVYILWKTTANCD